jgi:four helix bundle suffix protein
MAEIICDAAVPIAAVLSTAARVPTHWGGQGERGGTSTGFSRLFAPTRVGALGLCVIHQNNYLLDQQLRVLEKEFLKEGGFTERLYRTRSQIRNRSGNK